MARPKKNANAPDPIDVAAHAAYEARRKLAVTQGDANDLPWEEADEKTRGDAAHAVNLLQEHPNATIEQFHGLVGDGETKDLGKDELLRLDSFYRSARASLGLTGAEDSGEIDPTPTIEQAQAGNVAGQAVAPPETVEMPDGVTEVLPSAATPAASFASASGEDDALVDAEKRSLAEQFSGDAENVDSAAVHLSRVLTALGVTKPDDAILTIATLKEAHHKVRSFNEVEVQRDAAVSVIKDVQGALGIGDVESPVAAIALLKAKGNDARNAQGEPERDGRKDKGHESRFRNLPPLAMGLLLNASARAQGMGPAYTGTPRSVIVGRTEWTVVDDPLTLKLIAETGGSARHQAMMNVTKFQSDVANAIERERQASALCDQIAHASSRSPEQAEALATRKQAAETAHDATKVNLARLKTELATAQRAAEEMDVVEYEFPARLWESEDWN